MLISTNEDLQAFCARATSSAVLAIDTEFMREKTYYPYLCLIQMATDDEVVIVDPLAALSLSPIAELLVNPHIVKVFHAASQDLEIIYHELGARPKPIFDTQVAATLLGYGPQVGDSSLVHGICGVTLPKTESYTDWSKRPLSPSQISYAEEDVIYLPKMYRLMTDKLAHDGREHWLDDEFDEMVNVKNFVMDDRERYLHVKRVGHLSRRQLGAAREVCAWREATARKRNIPRKWVLADEQIVEACRREPKTIDSLFEVRGIREKLSTADARSVVELIRKGLSLPDSELPSLGARMKSEANVDTQIDLMLALVRKRGKEQGIASQTLASRDELEELARYENADCALLKGWKYAIVGKELVQLLHGEIALSIYGSEMIITPTETPKAD